MTAAATAAVDVLTSPRHASAPDMDDSPFFSTGNSPGGGDGGSRRPGASGDGGGDIAVTGAVGVEFSKKGGLMAVALADGTVLLSRIDRYTSGARWVQYRSNAYGCGS